MSYTDFTEQRRTRPLYRPSTALVVIKEDTVREHLRGYLESQNIKVYTANEFLSARDCLQHDRIDVMITGEDESLDSLIRYVERGSGRHGTRTVSVNGNKVPEGMVTKSDYRRDLEADITCSDYGTLIEYVQKQLLPDYMSDDDAQTSRHTSELEARAIERKVAMDAAAEAEDAKLEKKNNS